MHKFNNILLTLVILAITACTTGESLLSSEADSTPTPLPPEPSIEQPTYTVQRGDVVRELDFTARVAAVQEASLYFQADGYLSRLTVQRGDMVSTGDILAELTVADLLRQLDTARLELEQAQIESSRTISRTWLTLQDRSLDLERTRSISPDPQVLRAEVTLANAQQALIDAEREYRECLDREWETPEGRQRYADMLIQAETGLSIATAEYNATALEHSYSLRQLELAVEQAQLDYEAALQGVDPRLAHNVEQLEAQIAERRIIAPFDGLVLSLSAMPGDRVEAYSQVLIVGDPTELELRADLATERVNELAVGQAVTLFPTEVGAQSFSGTIRQLPYGWGGDVDGSDRAVHITPGSAAPELALDDLLRATVVLEQRTDVLWLSPSAIQSFQGRNFVFVQDTDGTQRRIDVVLGIESDERVEIISGLEQDQVVILP